MMLGIDPAYRNLAVALAAGLLVGIERGWRQRAVIAGGRVAGVRTFALLGGLGGMIGLLSRQFQIFIPALILAGAVIMLVIGFVRSMKTPSDVSATGLIAALLVLAFGMLATAGQPALAMAAAAVTTMILSLRRELHRLIKKLGSADVAALARFAIIAAAVWPFLPKGPFGPYDAWNPQQLWIVVVLVTGFSFMGYAGNRMWGNRAGTLVTALIGGAYSSTAVTASLSLKLRTDETTQKTLSAGIALATAVMFVRVLILTAIFAGFAFLSAFKILAPAGVVALVAGLVLLRGREAPTKIVPNVATNPIAILPALGFLILVALTAVLVRWAEARYGGAGSIALILAVGMFDVDAAIITLGGLKSDTVPAELAGIVLSGAVLLNMIVKIAVVAIYGRLERGRWAIFALLASSVALAAAGAVQFASI